MYLCSYCECFGFCCFLLFFQREKDSPCHFLKFWIISFSLCWGRGDLIINNSFLVHCGSWKKEYYSGEVSHILYGQYLKSFMFFCFETFWSHCWFQAVIKLHSFSTSSFSEQLSQLHGEYCLHAVKCTSSITRASQVKESFHQRESIFSLISHGYVAMETVLVGSFEIPAF